MLLENYPELGQPLEWSRIAQLQLSHTSVPVYTRGESGLVVSEKQLATDSERSLFYSQHSEKSGKKTQQLNTGKQVNEFSAKPAISATTTTILQEISLSLDNQVIAPSLNLAAHFHLGRTRTVIPI